MAISRARFEELKRSQTTTAQKVLAAVPIQEKWGVGQITAELVRRGVAIQHKILVGCLADLTENGLVEEGPKLSFKVVQIREPATKGGEEEDMKHVNVKLTGAASEKVKRDPMTILEDLARTAMSVSEKLKELSEDIGNAAVEIQLQVETDKEALAKLRQLQSLLKTLGETTS